MEERVNIVRAAFEGTGVHSPVQGGLKQRAGQRCLPAGAGRGRHHHSGERYGLMFHGSSSSQWGSSDSHYSGSPDKMQSENPDILPFPGPTRKLLGKKRAIRRGHALGRLCPAGAAALPRHRMVRRSNPPIHTRRNPALNKETWQRGRIGQLPGLFRHTPLLCRAGCPLCPLSAEWVSKIFSGGCPE